MEEQIGGFKSNLALDMLRFEIPINYLNGDRHWVDRCMNVELREKSKIRGVAIWIIFKTIGQDGNR